MALEIVISVAGKLAESLVDPLWRQFQYLFSFHENIENLKKGIVGLDAKRARVQHSINKAERNAENIEEDVQNWLKSVEEVKEAANLVIEDIKNVQMSCFFCKCPNIKSRYSLSYKATKLSSDIQNLIEKGKFDKVGYLALEMQTTHLLPKDLEKFESRSLTVKEVSETLKDSKISIIGICGMAGVGKTKLVNEIAKLVKKEKSFDEVAVAVVSQNPDFISIQGQLADQLGLEILPKDSLLERAKRLCQRLSNNKKILIILDDLWADLDFASLGIPIKDGREGLKVMLTSRFRDVCTRMGAQRIIEVKLLNKIEGWLLFKEISGISDDNDLKNIAEEVARECGGLPLAIVSIGGTLKNKDKYVWKDILRQLKRSSVTTIEGTQNLVFSRIELSYECLADKDYKLLLLLCCLFPEDYNIPIEILVRYVKGLQMFNELETLNEIRDKIDTVVNRLKECYLLLPSESYDRHVKLHDVVRDVCLSIASKGEHVFMSRHEGLTEWPQIDFLDQFTAISLTFSKMNWVPNDLQCPRLRLLRLLCYHEILPDISTEGMRDLRILELNSHHVQSLLFLQCLTSLRTLCLDECTLETETSVIGCLKRLEILTFFRSTLLGFPKEVAQLTNLKLLDLRFDQHHPFPSGIFLGLKKLEELYMGYYEPENKEEAKQARTADVKLLSHLTTLQIDTHETDFLLQLLRGLDLEKMERFDIKSSVTSTIFYDYDLGSQRRLDLRNIGAGALSENSVSMLLKRTEHLVLGVRGLRNLAPELDKIGFNNLKQLELRSSNFECIVDVTNLVPMDGSIQPPWLCNLGRVIVEDCNSMTSLLPQSISSCLMHLQHLEISDCEMLEEIISMEESTRDKVVEFSKLQTLDLSILRRFKHFHSRNTSQALLNQVWLPALESLKIMLINCPRQIVGPDMPNGSLQKLERIFIWNCSGVACIAKADSLMLLPSLMELSYAGCDDVEVIFDFEGLKFTAKQTERLALLPQLAVMRLEYLPKLAYIWRMVPKGIQAFQNLRLLNVLSCHGLKYLLSPPSLAKMLANLQLLDVQNCENMEEIMGGEEEEEVVDDNIKEFVFPKLSTISLGNLEKLRSFSSREEHKLNFPSLTELTINDCPQWEKFPYALLNIPKLHRLKISHCEMEEIISMKGKTDDNVVEFSELQHLGLRALSKFKRFQSRNTSQALLNQVWLPALETLEIQSINCPGQIVGCDMPNGSLQKLERIDIWNCSGVACIAKADSLMLLPSLMELSLYGGCDDVEVIFDFEGLKFTAKQTEGLVLLPQLSTMSLMDLPKLAYIWRMVPKGIQAFQNLRDLTVQNCKSLKYLFSPPSLAKMLASLESLDVQNCENMEEIMGGEEEEEIVDDHVKEFMFPKLSTMRLDTLEKLTSFSSREEHKLNFPSLTELKIKNCPQLEKFSYGNLSAPMLQKVTLDVGENKVPIDLKDREIHFEW